MGCLEEREREKERLTFSQRPPQETLLKKLALGPYQWSCDLVKGKKEETETRSQTLSIFPSAIFTKEESNSLADEEIDKEKSSRVEDEERDEEKIVTSSTPRE